MFSKLRRFFCSERLLDRIMATTRYFPNTLPDYNGADSQSISVEDLRKFVEKIIKNIETNYKPIVPNGNDGLYLGTAGISYMFYHLSKNAHFTEYKPTFLKKAIEYLAPAFTACRHSSRKDIPSFILGNAGVYAVASVVYLAIEDKVQSENFRKLYYEAWNICKEISFLDCGSDEYFVGRAGYVLGALWLARHTNTELPTTELGFLCDAMIDTGRKYSQRFRSPCPLMYSYYDVEYLGAAHGLCTILLALLSTPGYLERSPSKSEDVRLTIDYLLSLQDPEGNFPCATDELGGSNVLVHWCHGAAGMIYLMAKAYLVYNDQKYLKSCQKMADLIWKKGLLKKGPGICHGVGGNGYAILLYYKLSQNAKYLYRAMTFAEFMQSEQFAKGARTPDYPFSLYEGIAGTACFLGDLLAPQKAMFPFMDACFPD